jgi:hypothetical protein
MVSLSGITLSGALPAHDLQLALNSRNAILNAASVSFQLRFAFTTAHSNAAFLPRQVAPEPRQARQQMLQLRQFDLQLAFFRASTLGKNVQDQRSPIQDFAIEDSLQIAALGRRKFVVENDRIHIGATAVFGEFVGLAFANESGRARSNQPLQTISDNMPSSGGGQFGKFLQ